jgi:RNA polymerase sigma-70 factor (ECF subfamily)
MSTAAAIALKYDVTAVEAEFLGPRYREHNAALRKFIAGKTRNGSIDDITQETWLRAWRYRDSYNGTCAFRSWLFTIAYHEAVQAYRKNSRYCQFAGHVTESDLTCDQGMWAQSAVDKLEVEKLLSYAAPLPRKLLKLKYLHGYAHGEIASLEGMTTNKVKMTVYHTTCKLSGRTYNAG